MPDFSWIPTDLTGRLKAPSELVIRVCPDYRDSHRDDLTKSSLDDFQELLYVHQHGALTPTGSEIERRRPGYCRTSETKTYEDNENENGLMQG